MSSDHSFQQTVKHQAIGLGLGAGMGAITGSALPAARHHIRGCPDLAMQAGSAITAAARNGASVGGSLAAGAAVVTAKAAAIATATTTVAVAAAPFVAGAAVAYGLYRWLRSS